MKGKLILIPLKEPKEGMKVVAEGVIKTLNDGKVYNGRTYANGFWYGLSELQQIAVEYETVKGSTNPDSMSPNPKYTTLPLHPDDYEKALPLIGKEVEFKRVAMYIEPDSDIHCNRGGDVSVAKLITPTPVMYTEEEVINLCQKATSFDKNGYFEWDDWWNENKKK